MKDKTPRFTKTSPTETHMHCVRRRRPSWSWSISDGSWDDDDIKVSFYLSFIDQKDNVFTLQNIF